MAHDSSSNAPSSARTSASAPPAQTALSESEFLTKQAADAKAAISRVVVDLKHDLGRSADPRAWMQVAPWTTLGVAAVAGFVAAAVAVPSKEDQALKRLKKIEEALSPRHYGNGHAEPANPNDPKSVAAAAKGSSFLSQLAGQVLHAVQPMLMSALTAGVTAKTVQPEAPPAGGADPGAVAYGKSEQSGSAPEI